MHPLAQRLLNHIRQHELLKAGDRVGVAVSGGIDSVALLRLLLELRRELGIVLSVVHFNHKLRAAESDADEQFVANLAREHDLEFYVDSDDVAGHARDEGVSLETAARELRYGFFRHLIGEGGAAPQGLKPHPITARNGAAESRALSRQNRIATGHTLDDQAETVLMHLVRGSGLRGLGGIHPSIAVEDDDGEASGEIVRPLLAMRRRELERYLRDSGQTWREDATNAEVKFTRNRLRTLAVPLLENEFNPAVVENLAELAEIARGEEDYWENEISGWMGTGVHWSEPEWARTPDSSGLVQISLPDKTASTQDNDLQSRIANASWLVMNASVDRLWLLGEPIAVQRRLVKAIGDQAGIPLEFKHVEEVLRCAAGDGQSKREISLPLGWTAIREPDTVLFLTPDLRDPAPCEDYEYDLPLPGQVAVSEAGSLIETRRVPADTGAYNPDHLLDADSLPRPLRVRNWRAGDRFWPAHTKSPKKIKELLQERHVAQAQRKSWPVVVSGNEIVWVRGFKPPRQFQAKAGREAVLILETPLDRRNYQTEVGPPVRGGAQTS